MGWHKVQHEVLQLLRQKTNGVSTIVDDGTVVVFGQQHSHTENTSTEDPQEQEKRSVCGAARRMSGFKNDEKQ